MFVHNDSKFSDVFDEEYFIKALEHDIPVVRKLPKELVSAPKANKQFRSWSNVKYYKEEIVQLWQEYKVILLLSPLIIWLMQKIYVKQCM